MTKALLVIALLATVLFLFYGVFPLPAQGAETVQQKSGKLPSSPSFSPVDGSPAQEKCSEDGGKDCARFPYYELTEEDRAIMSPDMIESLESWARIQKRRQEKYDRGEFPYFTPSAEEKSGWLTDLDHVVDDMFARMSEEELEELWATDEKSQQDYHHGLGTWVRNHYGLLRGNDDLLRSACGGDLCHPDRASAIIIIKFWDKVRAHEPQLRGGKH